MISSIIIDDEQHCIDALGADLGNIVQMWKCLLNVLQLRKEFSLSKKYKPQLIFLDVEMPWMNGFEMLELFDHIDFSIIFTTDMINSVAKAFRISAVDCLLKFR